MATGPLSIPKEPDIPGVKRFKGRLLHAVDEIERDGGHDVPGKENQDPIFHRENEQEAAHDAKRRQDGIERHTVAPLDVRMRAAQPDHRQADNAECRQRSDRGRITEEINVEKSCGGGDGKPDDQRVDPGGAELRVNAREDLRQQAVTGHAHKKGLTLKEAGLELGLVDEATFDRVVKPEKMLGR